MVVYGRPECCSSTKYLNPFEVWLSDEVGATGKEKAVQCGEEPVAVTQNTNYVGVVPCGTPPPSTVVTLLLPGQNRTVYLSELVVRGYQALASPPPAS